MKTFRQLANGRGFTMIEIMVVILIIGILVAIAIPNSIKARENSRRKTCVANLKQINQAKEQWAMDHRKSSDDTPSQDNLTTDGPQSSRYMKQWPECPSDGTYTINPVVIPPICDRSGHELN